MANEKRLFTEVDSLEILVPINVIFMKLVFFEVMINTNYWLLLFPHNVVDRL